MAKIQTVSTGLADCMDAADTRAQLDALAKKLIRHRIILAEILKECVEEFREFDISYIEQNCFVGEVRVDDITVDQDAPDADSMIVGSNTEDASASEGTARFDLVFDVIVPDTMKRMRLVINIEIQVDTSLRYSNVTRAVYYLARLISRQKGTVFTHSEYEKIQKVYSIWICPDPRKENRNSLAEYGFTQQKTVGKVDEPVENYDKMKAIIISLNDDGMKEKNKEKIKEKSDQKSNEKREEKNEDNCDIIRLLSALLSTTESVEKRKRILEDDFGIPMTREIEQEVSEMCNLGQAVEQKGIEEGLKKGMEHSLLQSIKNLMDSMKWSAQQAMDALKIPKGEQEKYAKQL